MKEDPRLLAGALHLPGVLLQGLTHIAPAAGLLLSIQFVVQHAADRAPLAYAIAFGIVLLQGLALCELARHLPSAGGYYTYISQTVHPRAGFLTAWLYFLYDPASTAINLAFLGALLERTLAATCHVHLPWWWVLCGGALFIGWICYRGVRASVALLAGLALCEVGVVVALCLSGLAHPGPAAAPPAHPGGAGLYMGVVLALFCFTGFESVAPLAEESAAPRRTLPRAIVASVVLAGAFYLFCSWALVRAWGRGDLPALAASAESPVFVLGRRLWGRAWPLLLLALGNSVLAVSIACTNAATRVFYAMGRAGALPRVLGRVHPVHHTPGPAILLQTLITLIVGLGLGALLGPEQEFAFLGVVMTLGMVLVYGAGNLGVFLLYRGPLRAEWDLWRHGVCPLLATVALLWVGVQSVLPLPPPPLRWAPLVLGLWLAAGACRFIGRS